MKIIQQKLSTDKTLSPLKNSTDMKIIVANCLSNLHLYRQSYNISSTILNEHPYNLSIIVSHIQCLIELGKQSELYKQAHDLICAYPSSAISWFAVGCYYFMIGRYGFARKFFNKSTSIDNYFVPAWIAFGHTFAEQDADQQSIKIYSIVNRLFPESYQPFLFMGMAYLRMNNLVFAEKFLHLAFLKFSRDPMIFNELGVVYFHQRRYRDAIDFFKSAVKYISADCYSVWESVFCNLGHCFRKIGEFENAHVWYGRALECSPRDPQILSSIAFTFHLEGELHEAIRYYEKVLCYSSVDGFANEMLHRALDEQYRESVSSIGKGMRGIKLNFSGLD